MSVPLYTDVHVPRSITDQLRRRGIDVLTAAEDAASESSDEQLLERARQLHGTIGQFVRDLELIALSCEPQDCLNTIHHIPF